MKIQIQHILEGFSLKGESPSRITACSVSFFSYWIYFIPSSWGKMVP